MVQHGEDIAKMVVRRRAIGEGTEAAQQVQLLAAEQGDVGDGLRAGKDGDQAEEQDLRQWVVHLALLAGIFQIIEMSQEDDDFVEPRPVRCRFRHSPPPACNRGSSWIQHFRRFVTYLLPDILLTARPNLCLSARGEAGFLMKMALVFPGQGSQIVGMGKALADDFPVAREIFDRVDAALSQKLSKLMFEGPEFGVDIDCECPAGPNVHKYRRAQGVGERVRTECSK